VATVATDTEVKVLAVKIRLARAGAKKAPFYRIVVADSRAPRDGRFIEILGRYNPRTEPSLIELNVEKADAWLAKGATASDTVAKLIAIAKNPEAVAPVRETAVSKKAAAKAAAAEAKAAAPAPAPAEPVAEPEAEEAPAAEETAAAEVVDEAPAEEAPAAEVVDEAPVEPADESASDEPAAEEAADAESDEAAE
jgi:small subunit ribosomal protein S16